MITLGTGLPGNGKTLFMLSHIAEKAKRENREVFYHNINLLDVEPVKTWQKCDPEKWFELPHGAIIVIDECQQVFPTKANGATLPEHYEKLAVHRHSGYDIYLITQHPTLIHNFARKLVGQHFHSVRKFGLQRATIYEWSAANPAPENVSSQKSAISKIFKYPVEVYGWYKSAEVHTVKRAIPVKLILAVVGIVLFFIFAYLALDRYQHRYDKPVPGAGAPGAVSPGAAAPGVSGAPGGQGAVEVDPVVDARRYLWRETPRVAGQVHTAPKYDELTKPVRVPVPAMCIQRGTASSARLSCSCYTQQATPIDVGFNECLEIARNGFFQEFDPDHASQAAQVAQQSSVAPAVVPGQQVAPAPVVAAAGPSVSVIPEIDRPAHRYHLTGETKLK
jgi:zona occludens toxin